MDGLACIDGVDFIIFQTRLNSLCRMNNVTLCSLLINILYLRCFLLNDILRLSWVHFSCQNQNKLQFLQSLDDVLPAPFYGLFADCKSNQAVLLVLEPESVKSGNLWSSHQDNPFIFQNWFVCVIHFYLDKIMLQFFSVNSVHCSATTYCPTAEVMIWCSRSWTLNLCWYISFGAIIDHLL